MSTKNKKTNLSKKIEKSNFSENEKSTSNTKIKIIGIGGGGSSIVSDISSKLKRVSFVAANTDKRALMSVSKKTKTFHFGEKVTGGFGTGMNFESGKAAASGEKEKIKKILEGQDMCILVSCLGGGTGSGAVPVFAKIAKEMGVITYGIFTLPFNFEGLKKLEIATEALKESKSFFNAITVLPNENIFKIIDKKTPLKEALSIINKRLSESLEGVIETIYIPGVINIDFADLKTIMEERGKVAYLNRVVFDSSKGIEDAVKKIVSSPFYSYGINGSSAVLFNIVGGSDLGLKDVSSISEGISSLTGRNSKIIFGISQGSKTGDKIKITLLAVGCDPGKVFGKKEEPSIKRKSKNKKKVKVKVEKKEVPKKKITENKPRTRRNAIEVKKVAEEIEKDIIEDESKWETPTFLRKIND
jgi:cell division protein FtsZ